jgi:hypothetical protein
MAIDNKQKITLIDGTELEVRPLKISLLRKFLITFEGIAKVSDDNDKSMDILLDCVQIAMEQYKPELAKDRDALEENLDLPTLYKIIEAASGTNLGESNLLTSALGN